MIATLPTELTIARAEELKAALQAALATGQPVELDGRAVQEVDVAGLQVLCAARRSALARGGRLTFAPAARSPALIEAIGLAGLSAHTREAWLMEDAT